MHHSRQRIPQRTSFIIFPNTVRYRITHGNVYADILRDRRGPEDIWIYVIQRQGSPDILAMGTCATEADARKVANKALREQFLWSPKPKGETA